MSQNVQSDTKYSLKCGINSFISTYIVGVLHPLDVIKTRFQSHDGKSQAQNLVPKYKGILDALKSVHKHQGFKGLYKGYHISMFTQASVTSLFFWLQYELRKIKHQKAGRDQMTAVTFASAQASITGTLLTQPLWVIRTRMLLNTNPNLSGKQNILFTCRQINQQMGPKGYSTGLYLSLLLSGTGVLQMYTYEGAKRVYDSLDIPQSSLAQKNFFCGALSKLFSVLLSYPVTTVRTRAQQNQYINNDKTKKYGGNVQIIRRTYRGEGIIGFYKGFQINLLKGVLQRGIYFYIYQAIKDVFLGRHLNQIDSRNQQ